MLSNITTVKSNETRNMNGFYEGETVCKEANSLAISSKSLSSANSSGKKMWQLRI